MDNGILIVLIIAVILAAQGIVWGLILWRMARQAEHIRVVARHAGERLVIDPERANYQGWTGRFGAAQTMGVIALTDHHLVFKKPIGVDICIPLVEVEGVSDAATFLGRSHKFHKYLTLVLHDGTEVVFLVKDQDRWMDEVRTRSMHLRAQRFRDRGVTV